ncbi:MAG: M48 family metallopeptidase [Acidobacteriota bacterium]
MLSAKTLHAIENSDPNDITGGGQASLRNLYRKIITLSGIYYYISQPVVVILVIIATVGVILFFLIVGYIPIKLMLILVFVGGASIFYMAKSLFTRAKVEDPGRVLTEAEAPELWSLVLQVATAVNTRAVDEIRITEATDLAVYERGGWRIKMQDKAERVLILGVANLNGFKQSAFTAVLAHEYGHFSNRDTAGGDVAFRVNTDMMRLAEAIVMSGTNTIYNVAFHFIRVYHFLFRRITHGATRLQETLADRVAAHNYGVKAFQEGLTHVVRRGIEFNYLALKEVNSSRAAGRGFNSLYDLTVDDESSAKDIETQFAGALNRKTTDDDTHPSPNDRFKLIEKVISNANVDSDRIVWDLFADRQALTDEMNKKLEGHFYGTKYASANDIIT